MENIENELEERELKELELMNENENREFYVYVHIRKDNNTVFYVGKGTKNRAYDLDRGNFHNGVRDKYGCKVVIIKDNLTESQAFRLESKMIKYYVLTLGYGAPIDGYRDYSNNYLTNFTWGGEGASGMHHTKEAKEKISEKNKGHVAWNKGKKGLQCCSEETKQNMSENHADVSGENNPMYGKHHSEESKRKTSESMKGKMAGENNPMYGKNHTEEAKQKMSEKRKGKNNPMAKKVICITTGKIFDCIKDAEKHYNIGNISKCCMGIYKHAGKLSDGTQLQWVYLEDYNNEFKGILINPIIK